MIKNTTIALLLSTGMAATQALWTQTAVPSGKTLTFEVASIRQNTKPVDVKRVGPPQFGPTSNGYRMIDVPLAIAIATAFPSQTPGSITTADNIIGLPDWAKRDGFDIDAKVSEEDLSDWQNPTLQPSMLQTMLQAMLVDRCKIVFHRETKESTVYLLTVGKNGPKFKETDPAVPPPAGNPLPGGAIIVPSKTELALHGTKMETLATLLTSLGGFERPVQDKTGLLGRYDIVISKPSPEKGTQPALDPREIIFSAVEALGLKLVTGKSSVETLVIDHIERPTAN